VWPSKQRLDAETSWPVFEPLDDDPRYEATKSTMLERWNAEMAKLAIDQMATGAIFECCRLFGL
jgi:hypothetical protein